MPASDGGLLCGNKAEFEPSKRAALFMFMISPTVGIIGQTLTGSSAHHQQQSHLDVRALVAVVTVGLLCLS
jgi:hypothetical protein